MKLATKNERVNQLKHLEQRWTRTLLAPGWTAVPSVILERQLALGLDATDINILLHLARFWWYRDNPPHPTKGTIATCMGISVSTVRRRIAQMEKDGLIQRVSRHDPVTGRQDSNVYHFDGLIRETEPYAKEALAKKEERRAEAKARLTRKRPELVVVKSSEGEPQ